jgi:hypothetical protein
MSARSLEDLERDAFLAESELIAQLVSHPAWPRYEALIANMRLGALELMANAKSSRAVVRYQGAAAILQELLERPHRMTDVARTILDEEAQRKKAERGALDFVAGVHVAEDDL